jgi:hypothetical protein
VSRINVTNEDLPKVAAEAWAALRAANAETTPTFVRVANMACVRTDDGLEAFKSNTLSYWLARIAVFYKVTKTAGEKIVKPPRWLINDMLAERVPDLPEENQR